MPETMSAADPNADAPKPVAGPVGIGGWLILPILHLIFTALLTGYNLAGALQYWSGLVALATGQADPSVQWMALPTFASLLFGVVVIAFAIYVLVLLFQKRRAVPKLMIGFYCLVLAVTLFESGVTLSFAQFQETGEDQMQAAKDIIRSVIGAAIWIPYFLVSKRVKATFVE